MKAYIEYMDSVTVDAQLHERIMQRITQKPLPLNRNKTVFRYAGLAACAAVLVLYVWMIPGLFNAPVLYSPDVPQVGEQSITLIDPDSVPEPPFYALTLNKVDSQMAGSRIFINGHFWHELNDEQLGAVLPKFAYYFPYTIDATAHYQGDGSLFGVVVYETENGDVAMYNEFYMRTEIQLAPSAIAECAIYEYEPIESDVYGVSVTAGVFDFEPNDGVALYIASFSLDGIAYQIKLHDNDAGYDGEYRLTALVNEIIRTGAADLTVLDNPVIPELRNEQLTLREAHSDPDFGAFIPENIPPQFGFESAQRFVNQDTNGLFALWSAGLNTLHWSVSKSTDYDLERIVSTNEHEKYDMSLYSIPLADSVPRELIQYVNDPVFLSDELTLDIVQARVLMGDNGRRGGDSGLRINFSVLYDEVVISLNANGVSPEQIWDMLAELIRE